MAIFNSQGDQQIEDECLQLVRTCMCQATFALHRFRLVAFRSTLTVLLMLAFIPALCQNISLEGKVVDAESRASLAFVNVIYSKPPVGTTTDIDGRFRIDVSSLADSIKFSYLGYQTRHVAITALHDSSGLVIELKQQPVELAEVVVKPGFNPAVPIIRKVYENRSKHNPENLPSFSYKTYNKFVFTLDSSETNLQKQKQPTDTALVDSTGLHLNNFMAEQYIFLMESVSERKYLAPGFSNERVLASRVSGFRDPSLVFLATQIQSFSFYDSFIELGDQSYLNPVSQRSEEKYLFSLEDTLYQGQHDTTVIISFKPGKNKNFDALKGMLHVSLNDYALTRVIAEPFYSSGPFTMKIQQKYDRIGGGQWFPVQLNTRIMFNNAFISTASNNYHLMGDGKTYIRNINLDPALDRSDFTNVALSVPDSAYERSDEYWNEYRVTRLDSKDRKTYRVVDSIGEAHRFDEKLKTFNTLSTGYYPLGFLNVDLTKIFSYNQYEGFRLGLGLMTNEEISRRFALGGYLGYGLGDNDWKYGGMVQLNLHEGSESMVQYSYLDDVNETGGYSFLKERGFFSSEMYRDYMVESMDRVRKQQVAYSFRALKYLKMNLFLQQAEVDAFADYGFMSGTNTYKGIFHITEAGLKFRWAWKEDFLKTSEGKFSLGTDYPVVYGNYIRGLYWLNGNFEYSKVEAAVSGDFQTRNFGKTGIRLTGGLASGSVPAFNLYSGHGSYGSKFNIYSKNSFTTMRLSEFLADRFVSIYFNHDFKSLLFREGGFSPRIVWANHAGWGGLDQLENHSGIDIQTYENGYFETGLIIGDILKTPLFKYGFGVFYRYGSYAFDRFSENLAYRMSLKFNFEP